MMRIRVRGRRCQFSLRTLLLLFVPVAIVGWLAIRLLWPHPIDARIVIEPVPLTLYEDSEGDTGMKPAVRITNKSRGTVWMLGRPGKFAGLKQLHIYGTWQVRFIDALGGGRAPQWTKLRGGESVTVSQFAIPRETNEMRVAVAVTNKWYTPEDITWLYSPRVKIVKRGEDYLPEAVDGSEQEERVARLGAINLECVDE